MKKLGLLAVAFIFSAITYAQKGAQIEFKTETIDYGTVVKGEDNGIRIFEFTNTGDEPLIISNVKTSCGCTAPSYSKEPIMPGKKGEVQVKYNMNIGAINRTVTVESNAVNKTNGKIPLRIKGTVVNASGDAKANVLDKKKALPQS